MRYQFRVAAVAVVLILAVGLLVTGITKSYIDRNSDGGSAHDLGSPVSGLAGMGAAQNAAKEEAEKQDNADTETVAEVNRTEGSAADEKSAYYLRLQEIDSALPADQTVSKAAASEAYKAWDSELNAIYQMIRLEMTEEEFSNLRIEEREWLQERDTKANQADDGLEGDDQEIAYLNSLTESTKARTYELAELYFSK